MPAGTVAGGRTGEAGTSVATVNPVAAENSVPPARRLIVTGRRHAKHIWNPSVIFVAAVDLLVGLCRHFPVVLASSPTY